MDFFFRVFDGSVKALSSFIVLFSIPLKLLASQVIGILPFFSFSRFHQGFFKFIVLSLCSLSVFFGFYLILNSRLFSFILMIAPRLYQAYLSFCFLPVSRPFKIISNWINESTDHFSEGAPVTKTRKKKVWIARWGLVFS